MIPVDRLLYKFDLKLNKVASGQNQSFSVWDKIIFLNEAQLRLIKQKVSLNNIFKSGFDSFKARYEELQGLVVESEEVTPEKTDDIRTSYQIDVNNLKEKYFLPVNIVAICSRGECKERVVNVPRIIRHSDINIILNNSHFSPSFLWQETVAVISGDKIILFANDREGDFKVDRVLISYLRYPNLIDSESFEGGYEHFDGTMSVDSDCELPEILEDELLELAVMEAGYNSGNINAAQAAQIKSKNSEL